MDLEAKAGTSSPSRTRPSSTLFLPFVTAPRRRVGLSVPASPCPRIGASLIRQRCREQKSRLIKRTATLSLCWTAESGSFSISRLPRWMVLRSGEKLTASAANDISTASAIGSGVCWHGFSRGCRGRFRHYGRAACWRKCRHRAAGKYDCHRRGVSGADSDVWPYLRRPSQPSGQPRDGTRQIYAVARGPLLRGGAVCRRHPRNPIGACDVRPALVCIFAASTLGLPATDLRVCGDIRTALRDLGMPAHQFRACSSGCGGLLHYGCLLVYGFYIVCEPGGDRRAVYYRQLCGNSPTGRAWVYCGTNPGCSRGNVLDEMLAQQRRYCVFTCIPSSFNCFSPTGVGASTIKSTARAVLGNGITSRRLSAPARIITMRSRPRAMPPCGGVPYSSASRKNPKRARASSSSMPSAWKIFFWMSWR